jgi:restriction system protein
MPQEVAIVLLILAGAIWLLVVLFKGILSAIDDSARAFHEAAARRQRDHYSKQREKLKQFVHISIPNELDRFEKEFAVRQVEFMQAQSRTSWMAQPPAWTKKDFQRFALPRKRSSYTPMCTDDIAIILCPAPDASTWSAKEAEIVGRHCKYPFPPPAAKPDQFRPIPLANLELQPAVFQIDATYTGRKDVPRYFAEEKERVAQYNQRRADLTARTTELNTAINSWNQQSRVAWEHYVAESRRLEQAELAAFERTAASYTKACLAERNHFKSLLDGYEKGDKQAVLERLDCVLDSITLHNSVPHTWDIDFDEEQKIAVVDIGLPDVVHQPPLKLVMRKSGAVTKPLNQMERREIVPQIHPAILLRTAYEVFRNDASDRIALLVVNGWVVFDDPATGVKTKAYTASLMVTKDQISNLNLVNIDPLVAFERLHGKSAGKLVEIIPIDPMLSLNRKDSRFVNAKEVLKGLGPETNLAAMDWQDFEHLIRELFEKEFSGRGAEVKITQASRDRGVDAIVFDPDPIHGGKYVIQAKRYTNTVDVSSVRDLCAVVKKEGASRGILVTTSTYGADAYAFANNEPVTLLNGAELLGLLKKHGYSFRIDLQEARRAV